ncbi:hypothetical protein [Mucilaginibacter sp.]|jgi:hypothetical protein|uniref:hypothetical protein n=1 Tax=Mucilaginibacter sp. TaxID=1882438 RepID=UPI003562639B
MQTKNSELAGLLGMAPCQEQITAELVNVLMKLLTSNVFLAYKNVSRESDFKHELNLDGQLDFEFGKPLDRNKLQNIRAAIGIWNSMDMIYRLTVLDAFATLYLGALSGYSPLEKTIIFCQIFINDFVEILSSN